MSGPSRRASVLAAIVVSVVSPAPGAGEIAIVHTGVECVVAERFPRLEAQVPGGVELARARIHFRPEGTAFWYSVEMARTGDALVGRLPRPKKSLASFRYYIEVTDPAFASSRTAEYAPRVAGARSQCAGKAQTAAEMSASVVLTPSSGAPPIPPGFAASGVTTAAAATAATAAAVGAAAAGGGGIGATAVIVGGAVVAAGAAVAVTAGGGDGGAGGDGDGRGGGPVEYQVLFDLPGLDVSSCVGRPTSWCCQPVHARPDGSFDETWSATDPNTVRIAGRVTASTFDATLNCVSGGAGGSISATGSNASYRGTFEFRGSRGGVTVRR